MISLENMITLLEIKDGYDALAQVTLGNIIPDDETPLAKIFRIYRVIRKLSPSYLEQRDEAIDYDETEFSKIIESDLPNEEKARKLLMLDDDEMDEECKEDNASTMSNHAGFTSLKLEIFIAESHFPQLQEVLHKVDVGHIGNYDYCLSYSNTLSTWRPLEGTNPYIGSVGELSQEQELKVEVTIRAENLDETLSAIRNVHPYEEPVINVIPLLGTGIFDQA